MADSMVFALLMVVFIAGFGIISSLPVQVDTNSRNVLFILLIVVFAAAFGYILKDR